MQVLDAAICILAYTHVSLDRTNISAEQEPARTGTDIRSKATQVPRHCVQAACCKYLAHAHPSLCPSDVRLSLCASPSLVSAACSRVPVTPAPPALVIPPPLSPAPLHLHLHIMSHRIFDRAVSGYCNRNRMHQQKRLSQQIGLPASQTCSTTKTMCLRTNTCHCKIHDKHEAEVCLATFIRLWGNAGIIYLVLFPPERARLVIILQANMQYIRTSNRRCPEIVGRSNKLAFEPLEYTRPA